MGVTANNQPPRQIVLLLLPLLLLNAVLMSPQDDQHLHSHYRLFYHGQPSIKLDINRYSHFFA